MRLFVHLIDGIPVAWGLTDHSVRLLASENVCFPERSAQYEDVDLSEFGIETFFPTLRPEYDPMTQDCRELPPVLVDGTWRQQWTIVAAIGDQAAQRQREAIIAARVVAKEARSAAVAAIRVTIDSGKIFDGDELSQGRMARAIIGLQAAGAASMMWTLAGNEVVDVTLAELTEAMIRAGQEQARLWPL